MKRKGRKGYPRLATGLPRSVNLGTVIVSPTGFGRPKRTPRRALIDLKRSVPLVNGAPRGAGSQGATKGRRSAASASLAGAELTPQQAQLGADMDRDGVPNTADVDLNGDGVLDAAQTDTPLRTAEGKLGGLTVLEGRHWGIVDYKKILGMDRTRAVNSNRNPGVTWEVLTDHLNRHLMVEAAAPPGTMQHLLCDDGQESCDAAGAVTLLTMNCAWLAICQPGSAVLLMGPPDSSLDRQPLTSLLDANGAIPMPREPAGGPLMDADVRLAFYPRSSTAQNPALTGDTYEFSAYSRDGTLLDREAKVLTSSVVTSMEWQSIAGIPVPVDADLAQPFTFPTDRPVQVAFYRPQRLTDGAPGDAPALLDRGGLQYSVTLRDSRGDNTYYCRASQVNSVSEDLVDLVFAGVYEGEPSLYDKNLDPANGTALGFTLDIPGCLSDPQEGPRAAPPVGSMVMVEVMASDSDGNRAMSDFGFILR